jgi:hypothetical protein
MDSTAAHWGCAALLTERILAISGLHTSKLGKILRVMLQI